ncbi:MAG: PPC domain-containing DNA-binding protein [Candidatus Sericytochromatia bacterium]
MKKIALLGLLTFCLNLGNISYSMENTVTTAVVSQKSERNTFYTLRLKPNQDLKKELQAFVKKENIKAGFVVTAVGSLKKAIIRFANQKENTVIENKFEIVSLVGTMGQDGLHLHISISDENGKTIGGHLADGSLIYTTAEIVLGELNDINFVREKDEETTYKELMIYKK